MQLIQEFGDVHKLIKNANQIPQEKRRNIILDHEEDILVSLKLVKLKDDIKLPIDINKIHTNQVYCPHAWYSLTGQKS